MAGKQRNSPVSAGTPTPVTRPAIHCAVYTRKSTDEGLEQSFNSLDAQREAAEAFIASQRHENWTLLAERYDDGGFTGANMDRPALKRLLADVEAGQIKCVVVYKVDRLTRSLLDFSRIIEALDRHGVTFVSVTQQFNTTTSLGRLTLNILLSFAQFEREMISERTRDKMSAARRKGKWVGGNPVLGYDVAPEGGRLLVNEAEGERVRAIYDLYLQHGALMPVVQELESRGWRMKQWTSRDGRQVGGALFTKNRLYNLLTNIIYTGRIHYSGEIISGEQSAIVASDLWNKVQEQLNANGRTGGRLVRNKYAAVLKNLLRCGTCDAGMVHTYTRKGSRLYRYYVCVNAHQRGWAACATRSVSAPEIEDAIVNQIRGIGSSRELLEEVMGQIQNAAQENRTAGHKARRTQEIQHEISRLEVETALRGFDQLWRNMTTSRQQTVFKMLLDHVRYDGATGKVTVAFRSAGLKQLCTSFR